MHYAETILPEFDREMAITRKVLGRVPEGNLDWQAHPESHTIGWNANHLAEIPECMTRQGTNRGRSAGATVRPSGEN